MKLLNENVSSKGERIPARKIRGGCVKKVLLSLPQLNAQRKQDEYSSSTPHI